MVQPQVPVTESTPEVLKPASNIPYLVAIVFMMLLGVIGVLLITFLRPDKDNSILITLVIGFLTPVTGTILTFMKSQETHLSVNSRLDAFMKTAKASAYDKGVRDGTSTGGAAVAALVPVLAPVVPDREKAALQERIEKLEALLTKAEPQPQAAQSPAAQTAQTNRIERTGEDTNLRVQKVQINTAKVEINTEKRVADIEAKMDTKEDKAP